MDVLGELVKIWQNQPCCHFAPVAKHSTGIKKFLKNKKQDDGTTILLHQDFLQQFALKLSHLGNLAEGVFIRCEANRHECTQIRWKDMSRRKFAD